MKHARLILLTILFLCFLGSLVFGQANATMTEKELTKFIQDWPAVEQWLESKGRQFDTDSVGQGVAAMFVGTDFANFLRGKGWSTERFSYVAGTTFALVGYVAFEKQNPEMVKEFDDAIQQVREDASTSQADKAAMIKSLEDAKRSMLSMSENLELKEAEIKLVRAKYDQLMKFIDK